MKEVDPKRFQKRTPEDVAFKGAPILDHHSPTPLVTQKSVRTSVRTEKQGNSQLPREGSSESSAPENAYIVEIPGVRRKIRHPFDIYEDQLEALKKLQIAIRDEFGGKQTPTLGDMAREALDNHIKEKITKSPNIQLVREG